MMTSFASLLFSLGQINKVFLFVSPLLSFSTLGFYFVRNNPLTMYFFSTLLRMGDLISATKSHQAALAALLAEFSGWKGLRVKTWSKSGLFPGGVEYHQNRDYMKNMIDGKIDPFIFHMSWYVQDESYIRFLIFAIVWVFELLSH